MIAKKRYGTVAVVLHLIAPGLGFLYAGKFWTAFIIPFFLLSFVYLLAWSRVILEPWGVWLIWAGCIFVYLLLVPIVFFVARANSPGILRRSQRRRIYSLFVLVFLLLVSFTILFRSTLFGYETFLLPSRSMANTLLPRDYIIVDTWAYTENKPKQGDILVFKYPPNPKTYFTKRLVAGPGDSVSINKGKVWVNNILLVDSYVLADNNQITAKQKQLKKVVPEGHYFVMGDNRDHSNDSRYWGFLKENAIYGKAVSIWFSYTAREGVRIERIRRLEDQ